MMQLVRCTFRFFLAFTQVAIFVAIFSDSVFAAVYYLNPATGNDGNTGTQSRPWKTMPKVKKTVVAGDVVNILGGTYTQSQIEPGGGVPAWTENQAHGTAGKPIIVQANPGDTVIFDGQGKQYWQYFEPYNGPKPGFAPARYVIVQNLQFRNYAGAVITIGSASYVAVLNCRFTNPAPSAAGVPLATLYSHHVILRNNIIKSTSSHLIYISDGSQYVVLDRIYGEESCKYGLHGWGHGDYSQTTKNIIIRNNTLVNIHSAGALASGGNYTNLYIYNNTFYQERTPCPGIYSEPGGSMVSFHLGGKWVNTHVKNNVGYGYNSVAPFYGDRHTQFNGSLFLDYNLWTNLTNSTRIYYWDSIYYTLANFRAATGYETHSVVSNPLFVDATRRNFNLQSTSPAVNAGTFLTTTVGSGSGTTFTVADAGYFIDGFGLVTGDAIQVGSNSPVQITSINYGTKAITVARSISWSNGQGVSLPYSGTRPDMGAYEYTTNTNINLPPPTNLSVNQIFP